MAENALAGAVERDPLVWLWPAVSVSFALPIFTVLPWRLVVSANVSSHLAPDVPLHEAFALTLFPETFAFPIEALPGPGGDGGDPVLNVREPLPPVTVPKFGHGPGSGSWFRPGGPAAQPRGCGGVAHAAATATSCSGRAVVVPNWERHPGRSPPGVDRRSDGRRSPGGDRARRARHRHAGLVCVCEQPQQAATHRVREQENGVPIGLPGQPVLSLNNGSAVHEDEIGSRTCPACPNRFRSAPAAELARVEHERRIRRLTLGRRSPS